jgi:hypothetical protein
MTTGQPDNVSIGRRWMPFTMRLLVYVAIVAALPLSWLCRTPPLSDSPSPRDPESETLRQQVNRFMGGKQPPHNPPALTQADAEPEVGRLIGMGFLKFAAEPQHAAIRSQLLESATQRHLNSDRDDNAAHAARLGIGTG